MILAPPSIQTPAALDAKTFESRCGELSKANDWKGLESLAQAQVRAQPKDAPAHAALGFALLAQGRTAEAQSACDAAIGLDRHEVAAYIYLGLIEAQAGNRDAVIKTGRELAAVAPFAMERYYKVPAIFQAVGKDPAEPIDLDAKCVTTSPQPPYPVEAKYNHIQGTVVLDMEVAEDGTATILGVLSGPEVLVSATLATMKGATFEPLMKDGHPVKFRTPLFAKFRLANASGL